MEHNTITEVPVELQGMGKLMDLNLFANKIKKVPMDAPQLYKQLKKLDIELNYLNDGSFAPFLISFIY